MDIKPIGKRLILLPSESRMRGAIFVPEQYKDAATSCLVVAKGDLVLNTIKPGMIVLCEVGFGDRKNNIIEGTSKFICQESNIYAVFINGKMYPIGNRILIRRDVSEKIDYGIVIPENRRFQSLDGTIERIGITRKPFRTKGFLVGDKIQLKEWADHMIGVTLEDGGYGLIVNEKDLLFKYEN